MFGLSTGVIPYRLTLHPNANIIQALEEASGLQETQFVHFS